MRVDRLYCTASGCRQANQAECSHAIWEIGRQAARLVGVPQPSFVVCVGAPGVRAPKVSALKLRFLS